MPETADGRSPPPVPQTCPMTLDDLLSELPDDRGDEWLRLPGR
jgi:hypothetical protein